MPVVTYSNPRKSATIENWPSGGKRVTAVFTVETKKNKQRVSRITIDELGRESKPKTTTYADQVVIVDGDDGKTYILEYTQMYGLISVMQGTMQYQHETLGPRDERFETVKALIS